MEKIKKYSISVGITMGLILIFSFFINLLNYFDLLNNSVYKIILIMCSAICVFTGSYILGKKGENKGYLEGIKFGIIMIIIFYIVSVLSFDYKISLSNLIYYLVILMISSVGAIFGINKKTNNQKD